MDPEKLRIARDKLTRVFRYLEALNQHRNPAKRQIREQLWNLWLHDLPDHPAIKRGGAKTRGVKGASANTQTVDVGDLDFVLKVQRPTMTVPPAPPPEIATWIEAGWDDPANEACTRESLDESEENDQPRTVRFADDPTRPAIFQRWKALRDEWARSEKPARVSMKLSLIHI